MKRKNKLDFLGELLNERKLSERQRARVLGLAGGSDLSAGQLEGRVERIEEVVFEDKKDEIRSRPIPEALLSGVSNVEEISQFNAFFKSEVGMKEFEDLAHIPNVHAASSIKALREATNTTYRKKRKHDPKKVLGWLQLFTKNNSALKYSTHIWDQTGLYQTYGDFVEALNKDLSNNQVYDMQNYSSDLYWEKIFPFLIQKELTKLQKDLSNNKKYGWGTYEMAIGWQYDKIIEDWCKKNFDNKGGAAQSPFTMKLPEDARPEKSILGTTIDKFENAVYLFKKEIEFRDSDLYLGIKRLVRKKLSGYEVKSFISLQECSFYTNTEYVLKAVERIFDMIRARPASASVDVSCKLQSSSNEYILKIRHADSFANKSILDPKLTLEYDSGDMSILRTILLSLCDFSVESKFKDDNGEDINAELKILYNGVEDNEWRVIPNILQAPVLGFTYILKFPV
ncbi:hypothetical protein [Neolewinella antarctica]|uniref:Histidine Kinase domain-containing protein n=1 Tax=Neolewinella antarctica TaxID=442734 RepID=A0ABX0XCM6_9BACT|nr:hypothetical protein [Neolewinella antarctica]NJC27025.1 hypothetical protein [Neolewinella antarctica]